METHYERTQKIKRERAVAAALSDVKRYYSLPNANWRVAAKLLEWRKGEKVPEFDRATRWIDFHNMMMAEKLCKEAAGKYGTSNWALMR
jgi:hypothetical protein